MITQLPRIHVLTYALLAGLSCLTACHTAPDRALRDEVAAINRAAPVRLNEFVVIDSASYEASTRALVYHYTLSGAQDDEDAFRSEHSRYAQMLREEITQTELAKKLIDEGYTLIYRYHSATTGRVLDEFRFEK